ncbi:MAG: hypothetical protein ACI4O7_04015 [Aristaeellaceae bacterium]
MPDVRPQASLLITHLNETHGRILFADGGLPAEELPQLPAFRGTVQGFYRSSSRYASEIQAL